jgi:hypothetical protein
MPTINKQTFAIPTGGTTDSIPIGELPDLVHLTGSGTQSGNYALQVTGSPGENNTLSVLYDANMDSTSGSYKVTILGAVIPDALLAGKKCIANCIYNSGSWDVVFNTDASATASIPITALQYSPYTVEDFDYTVAGTSAGTSEEILATLTIPADTLDTNGDYATIHATGAFAATATTKTIRLNQSTIGKQFGSNGTTTAPNGLNWQITGRVQRVSATVAIYEGYVNVEGVIREGFVYSSDTCTFGSDVSFTITGQNGTANLNDIVCQTASVTIAKVR